MPEFDRAGVTTLRQGFPYARNLIEATLDPAVTFSVEGKLTDVNKAMVAVTGVSREQLIGSEIFDYFTEPQRAREGFQVVAAHGVIADYPLTIRHCNGELTEVLYNASTYRD